MAEPSATRSNRAEVRNPILLGPGHGTCHFCPECSRTRARLHRRLPDTRNAGRDGRAVARGFRLMPFATAHARAYALASANAYACAHAYAIGETDMPITYHNDLLQGSDEWLAARCGLLTASEMRLIMTPTLKAADNDKSRAHVWEIAAQRISRYVEPAYISDDMLRGHDEETYAREEYASKIAPVEQVGFITNDRFGFTIGYSPDGLVGHDGLIECKSRRQKYQVQTIVEWYRTQAAPVDFLLQCQTGLLVTERKWIDLISYSGGLPMLPMRINADPVVQAAIEEAAAKFEANVAGVIKDYEQARADIRMIPTERRVEEVMF